MDCFARAISAPPPAPPKQCVTVTQPALPANIHGAIPQESDAPLYGHVPAIDVAAPAGEPAAPRAAGAYPAPRPCADGRGYNAASIPTEAVAGGFPPRGARNPRIPAGACPAAAHTVRWLGDSGAAF